MSEHTCPACRSENVAPVVFRCLHCQHSWEARPPTAHPLSRLEEIRRILMIEHSESRLAPQLAAHLEALRQAFAADRTAFSSNDIDFLRSVRDILGVVESFRGAVEEVQYIENAQDYQDCRRLLTDIRRTIGDIALRKRVDRELRALAERRPELEARFEDAAAAKALLKVESETPNCSCGATMVIRTTQFGDYWGCPTFPVCWYRRGLSANHESILRAVREPAGRRR